MCYNNSDSYKQSQTPTTPHTNTHIDVCAVVVLVVLLHISTSALKAELLLSSPPGSPQQGSASCLMSVSRIGLS